MNIGKTMGAACLAALVACAVVTPASAACWQSSEVSAAMIRDLQTRFMVAGLKCRGGGPEMLAAYNRFVVAHRNSIQKNNAVLRARFVKLHGAAGGQRNYDRYTTALANAYGATDASPQSCTEMTALARRAANARAVDLAELAQDMGLRPAMAGGACPMRMASTK